jgi:hypothetical protein
MAEDSRFEGTSDCLAKTVLFRIKDGKAVNVKMVMPIMFKLN